jgi:hypothetical protein
MSNRDYYRHQKLRNMTGQVICPSLTLVALIRFQVRLGRIDSPCLSHAGFSTAEISQLNKLERCSPSLIVWPMSVYLMSFRAPEE